jgi:hypothetical protein
VLTAVAAVAAVIGWTAAVQRSMAGLLGADPLPPNVIGALAAALVATSASMCGIATVLMLIWSRRDSALARTVNAHSRYPTLSTLTLALPGVMTGLLVGLIGQLGLVLNLATQAGSRAVWSVLAAAGLMALMCWTGWFMADLISPALAGGKSGAGLLGGLLPALLVLADVAMSLPAGATPRMSDWVTTDVLWGAVVSLACAALLTLSARQLARRPVDPEGVLLLRVPEA